MRQVYQPRDRHYHPRIRPKKTNRQKQAQWANYIPVKGRGVGRTIKDFYGSSYKVAADGSLRLIEKVKHETKVK